MGEAFRMEDIFKNSRTETVPIQGGVDVDNIKKIVRVIAVSRMEELLPGDPDGGAHRGGGRSSDGVGIGLQGQAVFQRP